MDYCSAPEYTLLPSNVLTGSMAASYQQRTDRVHAVRMVDGKPDGEAACGYAYRRTDLSSDRDWKTVMQVIRCRACAEKLGVATGAEA